MDPRNWFKLFVVTEFPVGLLLEELSGQLDCNRLIRFCCYIYWLDRTKELLCSRHRRVDIQSWNTKLQKKLGADIVSLFLSRILECPSRHQINDPQQLAWMFRLISYCASLPSSCGGAGRLIWIVLWPVHFKFGYQQTYGTNTTLLRLIMSENALQIIVNI